MTLLELAAKCEAATGSDRELDTQITVACGYVRTNALGRTIYTHGRKHGAYSPKRYTASLDAALTLVPEGWWIGSANNRMRCHVELFRKPDTIPNTTLGHAWSLPLALCAAALRARNEQVTK